MNKRLIAIIIACVAALTAFALAGCNQQTTSAAPSAKGITVTLPYNAGTGYAWTVTAEGTALNQSGPSTEDMSESSEPIDGGPLQDVYTYTPAQAGTETLTFTFARPWEATEDDESFTVEVVVEDDLSYSVKSVEPATYADYVSAEN